MVKRVVVLALFVSLTLAGCGAAGPTSIRPAASRSPVLTQRDAAPGSADPSSRASRTAPKPNPTPTPNACAENTDAQLVLVSIAAQHVWMCARTHLVYGAPVTTGAVDPPYDNTPTGSYQIQAKDTHTTLSLRDGSQYQVSYWIPFDAPLFGFHDSSWQRMPYGSQRYRTEGSHGCIHVPLAAMKFLYDWADIGASVTIRA
ncbi:MAG: L,D-transpeptidase [Jatrophihabitantaceae bacterium]